MNEQFEGRTRSDSSDVAFRKIFIGGLSYSTDEEKLRKYFKNFGAVQDAVVMKDPVSKRSRGFGFITFYDISSVDNVLANEPHTIDARKVEAKRAVPRSEMNSKESSANSSAVKSAVPSTPQHGPVQSNTPQSSPQITPMKSSDGNSPGDGKEKVEIKLEEYAYNKIFVGGLHYDTRDPDFRSYFEKYGKVISAEVMFNRETHKSRGFGFIVFELEESAIRVCSEKEHVIDGKVVEVKRAIPRSKIVSSNSHSQLNMLAPPNLPPSSINSNQSSGGKSTSPTENSSPNSAANIRNDVRRTLSLGNASMMSPPHGIATNSSSSPTNSGILSLKMPQINLNNSQLPPSGAKKVPTPNHNLSMASANATAAAAAAANARGSYAAALKLGASLDEQSYLNSSNLGTGLDSFSMNINNNTSSSNLQSLYHSNNREIDVRQSRALSEPIKFDNSFAFSHDIFDLNSLRYGAGSAGYPNNSNGSTGVPATFSSENIAMMHNSSIGVAPDGRNFTGNNKTNDANNALGSFGWLGGSPTNKFDTILDPNQSYQNTLGGELTRSRAHSLGPTTLATSSRSPGFLGYTNYSSFSNDNIITDSGPQSPTIDRQYQLSYGVNQASVVGDKNLLFTTPSRVPGAIGQTPQSTALKQKSPGPELEWSKMLNANNPPDNSNLITGSLLGLLGENNGEGRGSTSMFSEGLLGSDTSGSLILNISRSNSTQDFVPQRRHSHPLLPNQDLYDASFLTDRRQDSNAAMSADPWRR